MTENNFNQKIKNLLHTQEKSVTDLAQSLGIARGTFYYKMQHNSFRIGDLKLMALFFEVSVGEFFE